MTTKKVEDVDSTDNSNRLALKYRPRTFARVLGHETVVTRLRGMVAKGTLPSVIAFFGPPSAGKTTLARVLAAEFNGRPVEQQPSFKELNAATQRGIDDVRDLEKLSKFRPMDCKQRFIVIDEAQQFMSNAVAAQGLLKPMEEPGKSTTWIICSMEPDKFQGSKVGRAILSRATQFVLNPPTASDMLKQALRIAKGESMDYVLTEDRSILKAIVKASNQELRVVANLMADLQNYYDGLGVKPKFLSAENVSDVLASTESSDDEVALKFMVALYSLNYKKLQRALLDVTDGFGFIKKICWLSSFILNTEVLDGVRHSKVWSSPLNKKLHVQVKAMNTSFDLIAQVNAKLIQVQGLSMQFQVQATELLSSELYGFIKSVCYRDREVK